MDQRWPPQWLTADWLRDTVRPIQSWVGEYPILAGSLLSPLRHRLVRKQREL